MGYESASAGAKKLRMRKSNRKRCSSTMQQKQLDRGALYYCVCNVLLASLPLDGLLPGLDWER